MSELALFSIEEFVQLFAGDFVPERDD